jgi:hypothetical protein
VRAVDWHLDSSRPTDRREARRLIDLLLATCRRQPACPRPAHGKPYSASFTEKGKPRKHVDRTTAHRDHIHFGLSWAGARKRTSFWRPDDD